MCSQRDENTSSSSPRRWSSPSFSFSFSSFLLFFVDDLGCAVACPELAAAGAEDEEVLEEPAEAASAASTLLPHSAQESSCSSTGDTLSSTRKLTCRRKHRTAAGRGDGAQLRATHAGAGRLPQTPGCPLLQLPAQGCTGAHPEGFTAAETLTSPTATPQRLASSPHFYGDSDSPHLRTTPDTYSRYC